MRSRLVTLSVVTLTVLATVALVENADAQRFRRSRRAQFRRPPQASQVQPASPQAKRPAERDVVKPKDLKLGKVVHRMEGAVVREARIRRQGKWIDGLHFTLGKGASLKDDEKGRFVLRPASTLLRAADEPEETLFDCICAKGKGPCLRGELEDEHGNPLRFCLAKGCDYCVLIETDDEDEDPASREPFSVRPEGTGKVLDPTRQ